MRSEAATVGFATCPWRRSIARHTVGPVRCLPRSRWRTSNHPTRLPQTTQAGVWLHEERLGYRPAANEPKHRWTLLWQFGLVLERPPTESPAANGPIGFADGAGLFD